MTSLRVPARAWFPAVLSLAVLAAFGTVVLVRRHPLWRRALVSGIAAAVVVEGSFFDATVEVPRPLRARAIPPGALVLDLPMDEGFHNAVPQYRAVVGGYRTINGYSGYQPQHFYPLRRAIADLVPDALDPYRRMEDLYVIVRPGVAPLVARWIPSLPRAEHLFDVDGAKICRLPKLR